MVEKNPIYSHIVRGFHSKQFVVFLVKTEGENENVVLGWIASATDKQHHRYNFSIIMPPRS